MIVELATTVTLMLGDELRLVPVTNCHVYPVVWSIVLTNFQRKLDFVRFSIVGLYSKIEYMLVVVAKIVNCKNESTNNQYKYPADVVNFRNEL